ncbi:hypothetical protein PsorP6_018169 [Peronosclerospora sorghi]|uniref:Uncharacterized protein n=1 Tax=Peronosclerospora sorghi TaxID=230839 RepID=A0ACC0WBV3_9STRA|nr:hypothetical protein PsorP6_018169 [Peronosclerospora sorghi]
MFALGIVLYILLCGSHHFDPYNNLTDEEFQHDASVLTCIPCLYIRTRILKGRFGTRSRAWHSISPSAQDLIRKLLEIDPDKRPSAEQALQHP